MPLQIKHVLAFWAVLATYALTPAMAGPSLPAPIEAAAEVGTPGKAPANDAGVAADAGVPSVVEVVGKVKAAAAASSTERHLAIAAMLAVVLRFLLGMIGPRIQWFSQHPHAYRFAGIGMGVAIFALDKFAMGASWVDALIAAGSGPGAVLVNEYMKMKPAKPAAETTSTETTPTG